MFQFAIDRGGTFTDIYAKCPGGKVRVMKLLSVDPANYGDAPREGIRRILEEELGEPLAADRPVPTSSIEWIRMGTTVATNALLERQGARMALLINAGFRDLLHIGNQARPKIFDLEIVTPDVLYEEVVEVDCRVVPAMPERCQLPKDDKRFQWREVEGSTGEKLLVSQELDLEKLRADLLALKERGVNSLAVVFAHAYTYGAHEDAVGKLATELGFTQVSLSHCVSPAARLVPRGFTCCADAYLSPHIKAYLNGFAAGFQDNLAGVNVLFMQSDGGLTPMHSFSGCRAVLSGPAGGVVGYARTAHGGSKDPPVIGFDMGGTSTDVSRFDGAFEHVFESTTAGVTIQAPQLDVNTVAAGGGSRLWFRAGLFAAGPESAGAHPGPACYRKGGPLTLTDANLRLGRLLPKHFPHIFGPSEDQPLDTEATFAAFDKMTAEINEFQRSQSPPQAEMTAEEVAMGFVRVANEAMCRPIRALTQAKGYDTSRHVLACFGGAGGQHACAVARDLGMRSVRVHRFAGILSAFGMALADVVHEAREPCALNFESASFAQLDARLDALSKECREQLRSQGFADDLISTQSFLNLRYDGTDCALMCAPLPASAESCRHGDFAASFLQRYQSEFGFTIAGRAVLVDDIRVRGIGASSVSTDHRVPAAGDSCSCPPVDSTTEVYFTGGYHKTSVYQLSALKAGHRLAGPAIVMDGLSTLLIEPDCSGVVTATGDLQVTIGSGGVKGVGTELDPVQLSIFSHRFMSIAEQMGRILQRTSISTNIKERLDFSCALFGPDGGLVSNAPHIPVHLGAMQETVQYQMRVLGDDLQRGDVILSNHPVAGGSHLPDLTVITPVFYDSEPRPVFYVASRGHHADIGGITPGSMPPHSTSLAQEGAAFKSFKLVRAGTLDEAGLVARLTAAGDVEGAVGTRNLADNMSDLRAQIAANQKGIGLVSELIDSYSLTVVQAYMGHIQHNAELAVRDLLRRVGTEAVARCGSSRLHAIDRMDDGSPIELCVDIDTECGEAVFDFTGTGPEVWGNCNAPRAITLSALIYCLRCMVGHDVPLNQGCLVPVKTLIPEGCLLSPSETAAVVGGNVLTSQRVVDVVLAAFQACAASQGCMNNITFGEPGWGYYETVAGGAGAGATWEGRGGVHTHMTNTRITDPELLERRYPVILRHFSLRPGSGGAGKHRGGDGVRRELLFRRALTLSVLTERRVFQPYGMAGGEPGERGLNLVQRCDGRVISLGPKTAISVGPGDSFQLLTPGGGGYGPATESADPSINASRPGNKFTERGSVYEWRTAQEQV